MLSLQDRALLNAHINAKDDEKIAELLKDAAPSNPTYEDVQFNSPKIAEYSEAQKNFLKKKEEDKCL